MADATQIIPFCASLERLHDVSAAVQIGGSRARAATSDEHPVQAPGDTRCYARFAACMSVHYRRRSGVHIHTRRLPPQSRCSER
jgi:hypothetical protein